MLPPGQNAATPNALGREKIMLVHFLWGVAAMRPPYTCRTTFCQVDISATRYHSEPKFSEYL